MKTVLFDVCGTLYLENTTFAYLRFILTEDKNFQWFEKWRKKLLFKILLSIVSKTSGVDIVKKIALKYLKGIPKQVLDKQASVFVKSQLTVINEIMQRLNTEMAQGSSVILLSGTIDPVTRALSNHLKVPYYCSELEYDARNICLGKLQRDILLKKHDIVARLRPNASSVIFYTDNMTDAAACHLADEFYVIIHNKKQNTFWKQHAPTGYIYAR